MCVCAAVTNLALGGVKTNQPPCWKVKLGPRPPDWGLCACALNTPAFRQHGEPNGANGRDGGGGGGAAAAEEAAESIGSVNNLSRNPITAFVSVSIIKL